MTTYVRAAANLILDYAHCDGMITAGNLGVGRDWPAVEPKEENFGFTPDIGGTYQWGYADVFEYVDKLKAIAPIRTYTRADMALTDWTLSTRSGESQWRLSSKAAHSQYRLLHMFDTAKDQYATAHITKATSVATNLGPNLQFWVWRGGHNPTDTDPVLFAIHFRPAGWPTSGIEYALCFPSQQKPGQYHTDQTGISDAQQTTPYLIGKPSNETLWTVITRKQGGASPTVGTVGSEQKLEIVRVEYDDGMLLVRTGEKDKGWVFGGKWSSQAGTHQVFALEACQIEVRVIGHTAMFAMAELTTPTGKVLYPRDYLQMPDNYNQTPAYKRISSEPTGTSLTIAADQHPSNSNWQRPKITFNTSSGGNRPLLYCVQEYRAATIGSADSSPIDTAGNANFTLKGISGQVSPTFRGSTMSATVEPKLGYDLGDLAPNLKVMAYIGATGSAYNVFTGYVTPPAKRMLPGARDAGTHHAHLVGQLDAADYVEARLARKVMDWHCSYEGWTEKDAFEHILNRAGVPSALISVDAACVKVLPSASQRGTRRFKFRPDAKVPQAIDTIAGAFGRRWGVRADGVLFLEPRYIHATNHYDYTIDYLTADPTWVQNELKATRTVNDFCNLLTVMVGEGPDATARILADTDSMWTPGYATFIGDVWSRFVTYPDASDIDTIAAELWREIAYWHQTIEFTLSDHTLIMPDDDLLLSVPTSVCPANSYFRVIGKSWELRKDGRYHQTIQAVRVQ